ncbi:hypothetical protein MEI_00942 [Bartonella vinsonii subsp. arupensis Pm136co]|uniref:Ornithine carbamoyltransferase n=1 Tax=Bartonella vinsonii subsp. arupensis Pm136co TaxID=1094561 RepID=A0ABN0GQX7_BARVI|nr:hypothetical protein MEI_00942 [Bartonella vinsonii subsp. arupensis Pm136co]
MAERGEKEVYENCDHEVLSMKNAVVLLKLGWGLLH